MKFWWSVVSFFLGLFWPFLILTRRLWDAVTDFIMKYTVGLIRRKTPLPPIFNPLLILPATTIAENIRLRKMTSIEVVRAFVTRCGEVNVLLNAAVHENFREALQNAREIDEYIEQGYRNGTLTPEQLKEDEPFLGVPFTVKETIAVKGFPHTAGLVSRQNSIAHEDAVVVQRMKAAGAILLARTNVPELGMWWECSNWLYGRTNNPYDTRRTSGGSSGGEASLMCAGGSPLSVGTDTGGSIRTPAFFCGLFGHKPTSEIVPVIGCNIFRLSEETTTVQVAGPITRHAVDLPPMLKVLAGDNACSLNLDKPVYMSRLQVYSIEGDGNGVFTSSVLPQLKAVQKKVCDHFLKTYDITVAKVRIPDLQRSYWFWQQKMEEDYPDHPTIAAQLSDNQGEINVYAEFVRNILGRQRHSMATLVQALLERILYEVEFLRALKRILQGRSPVQASEPKPGCKQLKMRIQRLLSDNGVLLYPTHPTLAPYHRESYLKPLNFTYTAIFNALGFPVTQVPLGIDSKTGLPLGIQVVGGMNEDRITMAVAKDLEAAFGGWKCPAKIL